MKTIYPILLATGLIVVGAGLILTNSGCDEIQAPCDIEETQRGTPGFDLENLESYKQVDGFAFFRFIYPENTIFFVCTDRTVSYEAIVQKRPAGPLFNVLPEARIVWKYAAPKPSKAVLTGTGSFHPLFEYSLEETTLSEPRISLAYCESELGGYFIPGIELKIHSLGNQKDDYKFIWDNFLLAFSYKIQYRMTY